jgi:hypothetical protein
MNDKPSQLQRTRLLASAFKRMERHEDAYLEAKREFEHQFGPWAAKRRIDRNTAREQLVSTGFLQPRKVKR